MPAPVRKTVSQLQAQCDRWNAIHPIGTLVAFEFIRGEGETHRGASRTMAEVAGGHSAVIWLEGKAGWVDLDHCMALAAPLVETSPEWSDKAPVERVARCADGACEFATDSPDASTDASPFCKKCGVIHQGFKQWLADRRLETATKPPACSNCAGTRQIQVDKGWYFPCTECGDGVPA